MALGRTTEHSHRPALKSLLESFGNGIVATNEPGREKCGAPDYLVTKPGPFIVGYIETKDIGKSLDEAEKSDQLKRYLTLENLLLTDYMEFRWYVNGKRRLTAALSAAVNRGKITRDAERAKEVISLLSDFLSHTPQEISTPKELAQRLAHLAHAIRDIIVNAFNNNVASTSLKDLRKAFATTLIPDLDLPKKTGEFADMYAQTIAYGLFAARCNHEVGKTFKRLGAAAEIPKTNPFLRRIFETITSTELNDEPYAGFVDDLVQLLANSNIHEILRDFGKRTKQQDPVVHFYETFLASYDPEIREKRGVYYTPEPVVSYIVRSIDRLLKSEFSLRAGLADMDTITYQWHDARTSDTKQATVPKSPSA